MTKSLLVTTGWHAVTGSNSV